MNFKLGNHYDQAFTTMSEKEVKDNLEAIAYGIEERSYTKNLTAEEVIQKKDDYSEIGIRLSEIALEKKEAMDRFKIRSKEPKEQSGILLQAIKFKSEQKFGELYLVDDQESGMMYSFDLSGVCVDVRPLAKKEKQLKLKTVNSNE
jgi:hypothetical protein